MRAFKVRLTIRPTSLVLQPYVKYTQEENDKLSLSGTLGKKMYSIKCIGTIPSEEVDIVIEELYQLVKLMPTKDILLAIYDF